MGLFSGEHQISVGVSTSSLFTKHPNTIKDAVLSAIINNGSIADAVTNATLGGFSANADRFYKYGDTTFTNGLPTGTTLTEGYDTAELQVLIDGLEGEPTTILSIDIGAPVPLFFARKYAQENLRYNPETNVVLDFHPPADVFRLDSASFPSSSSVAITCTYSTPMAPIYVKTKVYPISPIVLSGEDYFQVSYHVTSGTNADTKYWTYRVSSNTHPQLISKVSAGDTNNFYPIVPIKENKVDTVDLADPIKGTTKDILKIIGVGLQEITDNINDASTNPDADKVDSAFVTFAVDIQTTHSASKKYLYAFFERMSLNSVTNKSKWLSRKTSSYINQIVINSGDFNLIVAYNYIDTTTHIGSVGPIGECFIDTTVLPRTVLFGGAYGAGTQVYENSYITISKQVSLTQYTKITVVGLHHLTDVYPGKWARTTLENSMASVNGFYIPLHYTAVAGLGSGDRNELFLESAKLIIYAVQDTYVAWYKTADFLMLIQVIVTFITFAAGAGWVVELLAVKTVAAAAIMVLSTLAITVALKVAFELLVNALGSEFAFLLAVIAMVLAAYTGVGGTSLDGLPFAEDMLKMATLLMDSIQTVTADDFMELIKDTADFFSSVSDRQEEIDAANDLLGKEMADPLLFVHRGTPYFNQYETPDDYYNRAIHIGNVGVLSLDAVSTYIDGKLILPKLNKL